MDMSTTFDFFAFLDRSGNVDFFFVFKQVKTSGFSRNLGQVLTCGIFSVFLERAGTVDLLTFLNRSRPVDFLAFLDRSGIVDLFAIFLQL